MKKVHSVRIREKEQIPHLHPIISIITLVLGVLGTLLVTHVLAQTANNTISACAQKQTGSLRMVTAGMKCQPDETLVTWNIQGPPGSAGNSGLTSYYMCPGCNFTNNGWIQSAPNIFAGKDLTNAYMPFSNLGWSQVNLTNTNFTGAILVAINWQQAQAIGTNFTSAKMGWAHFDNGNLTNANFTDADVRGLQVPGANLSGVNFTNADLSDFPPTTLNDAYGNFVARHTDFTGANLTGVIWNNTICPDGTNSNNDGNTCVGHF